MNPYFDTNHLAGALLLVAVLCWGTIEAAHLGNSRQGATEVGGAGRRLAAWPFLTAASAVLYQLRSSKPQLVTGRRRRQPAGG